MKKIRPQDREHLVWVYLQTTREDRAVVAEWIAGKWGVEELARVQQGAAESILNRLLPSEKTTANG